MERNSVSIFVSLLKKRYKNQEVLSPEDLERAAKGSSFPATCWRPADGAL